MFPGIDEGFAVNNVACLAIGALDGLDRHEFSKKVREGTAIKKATRVGWPFKNI